MGGAAGEGPASSPAPAARPQPGDVSAALPALGRPLDSSSSNSSSSSSALKPASRKPSALQIALPTPPPPSASTPASSLSEREPKVRRAASHKSFASLGRRPRSKSAASSAGSSAAAAAAPRRYPPASEPHAPRRRNHDALFEFHLPHAVGGRELAAEGGSEQTHEQREAPALAMGELGKGPALDMPVLRKTSKEGPLDAYLPQTGPNAFQTQAYRPHPNPSMLRSSPALTTAAARTEAQEEEEADNPVTRDDYDRIGRIGGKTGVGWLACCAGVMLFTFTDCCCCCF